MRATCETCGQVQPPDWQPGDLCGSCGGVVRREKRCHWCVKLTPDGKFCRHCGAGQLPDAQYGAARWVKHLGADQFALPERLAAMEPEQVAHFTRLYQPHAMVVERHVGDLAYAEGFARQRGWARRWEEQMLPLLPLKPEDLEALALPPAQGTTDLEKLLEIRETSPLAISRLLSALARIRLWQVSALDYAEAGVYEDLELVRPSLKDPDPAVCLEVALTLSHWRFCMMGMSTGKKEIESILWQAAQDPLALEAHTNLAALAAYWQGTAQAVRAEALASEDPEIAFAAALANYAPDPLLAALRAPRRQYAAVLALTRAGIDFNLAALITTFRDNELDTILRALAKQARPRPDLRAYYKAAIADPRVPGNTRSDLWQLLALDLQPGDAARLLRANPDRTFGASLLQNPGLTPAELADLCREYVALDLFTTHNLPGGAYPPLPPGFVAENWRTAPANSLGGLRGLAEQQLQSGPPAEAQALHTFLRGVLWDEAAPLEARRQANYVLLQWYEGHHQSPYLALGFTDEAASFYFGSFKEYIKYFLHGINHLSVLADLETEDKFLRPLDKVAEPPTPADAAAFRESLLALPSPLLVQFRVALVNLALHYTGWGSVNNWAVLVLAQMQLHAPWRAAVRADLSTLSTSNMPDNGAVYYVNKALRTFPEPLDCALAYAVPMPSGAPPASYGRWREACPGLAWEAIYKVQDQLKEIDAFATDLAHQVKEQQLAEPAAYDRLWETYPRLDRDNLGALLRQAFAATR